jgi:acyl-coenzyme A synthetase/AMP-(fatty) acid ligase
MTKEGLFIFEGRVDAQVKVRGQRVDLSEVERAFDGCPGLSKVVVLCYNPGEQDQAS